VAVRTATYAFTRPVPYLLERGAAQTITAPIRHGKAAGLVAPDSGTITIVKPDGTDLVTAATATITGSVAEYTFTPATTETLGEGWEVRWSLTIAGVVYPTYRTAAYLCEYVPPNVISAIELYGRMPELKHRVPQSQGARGDDVGWQPQIDEAYYELLQQLLDDGRRPWLIREATGYRRWLLTRSLQLCVGAIPGGADSIWAQASKDISFEMRAAQARLRLQYSDDPATRRRGGSPIIRLSPPGRPTW